MKDTITQLDKQYTALYLQVFTTLCIANNMTSSVPPSYYQAVELVSRLGAENLYLKAKIQHQATWKLHLYPILESHFVTSGPKRTQQFQQQELGGKDAVRMQLDRFDAYEAAQVFGFYKLTEPDLT